MPNHHLSVFLVHGFRGNSITHLPLEKKLRSAGFEKVYRINYPSLKLTIQECCEFVANEIKKKLTDQDEKIILIAHSLGGVICRNLDKYNLNIHICFMIATPQRGCHFARYLKNKLSPTMANYILGKSGLELGEVIDDDHPIIPPNFDYWTIGTALPFSSSFDGVVHCKSMMIEPERHIHFKNSYHSIIIMDSRVHQFILNKLKGHNGAGELRISDKEV
jgi:hypothetical protein